MAIEIFKKHWPVLVLAILIGVIIIAPAFYFRYMSGEYRGVDLLRGGGESDWVASIREVYDGNYWLGNLYIADGKDGPSAVRQLLTTWIVGFSGKALHISTADITIAIKFVLPSLLSLIIYASYYKLTRSRIFAGLSVTFTMLIPATLSFFRVTSLYEVLVNGIFPNEYLFLSYYRTINPQLSSFFVYGYFLLLWSYLYRDTHDTSKKILGVLSAIVLGLSFYTYTFSYIFISLFSLILFVWYLVSKNYINAKKLFLVGTAGFLIGLPAMYLLVTAMQSPFYHEFTMRMGFFSGHHFVFSKLWWGAFLILVLFWRKIKGYDFKLFSVIFLLTALLVTNQQVLTGHPLPVPEVYHWYYIAPFTGTLLLYIGFQVARRYMAAKWCIGLAIVFSAACMWAGVLYQLQSYRTQVNNVIPEQRYAPILRWLDGQTPRNSVVLTSIPLSPLVAIYTHNNVYYCGCLGDFLVSTDRLKHYLFVYLRLDGLQAQDADTYFRDHRDNVGSWLYGLYYRTKEGCYGCYTDEIQAMLVQEYKAFTKKDFLQELKRYQLDYIVWDPKLNPSWRIETLFENKVYEADNILVYKVNPAP